MVAFLKKIWESINQKRDKRLNDGPRKMPNTVIHSINLSFGEASSHVQEAVGFWKS